MTTPKLIPLTTATPAPQVLSTAPTRSASFPGIDIIVLKDEESSNVTCETGGSAGFKTMDAALKKMREFEKAMASHSYGISTIHYGLILPLKEMVFGLTSEQVDNLDLYRKHTALCSGIKKVQKAFKAYTAAQEAADKAPTNPVTAREGARRQAIAAGTALVTNYEDLIGLAIDQAKEIEAAPAVYLNDLHGELDKDTKGLILKTVNTIRPNIAIETGLLDDKDSVKEELKTRYQKFVTEFVSNVQKAHRQSGGSSMLSAVTEAFIQGLAAIPELGELDDGLVLIELYGELSQKQEELSKKQPDGVAGPQDLAIQHFIAEIEALMNTGNPITTEDLQNIQYNGISLQSVKSIDVKELNVLQKIIMKLKDVQGKIQVAQVEIKQKKAIVEEQESYSFADVESYIKHTGNLLEKTPKEDGNALDRLAKFYTETLAKLAVFTKKKGEIQDRQAKATADRIQALADNEAAVTKAKAKIASLDSQITAETIELANEVKKLAEFEKAIGKELKKLADEKVIGDIKNMKLTGFQKESDIAKANRKAEINRLKGSLEDNGSEREEWQEVLDGLNSDVKKLNEENNSRNIKEDLALRQLDQECLALTNHQKVVFTGKDIKVITEKLESGFSEDIKILKKMNQVRAAEARVEVLTSKGLELQQLADDFKAQMTGRSQLLTLNDKHAFVLDAAIFGDLEKAEITTQLKSNLVIARKVTLEVGREIVRQDDAVLAALLKKANEDTKAPHKSKRAYQDRVSTLELHLDSLEDSSAKKLYELVQERVEKLTPVVPKKLVEASQPLSTSASRSLELLIANEESDIESGRVIDEDDYETVTRSRGAADAGSTSASTDAPKVAAEVVKTTGSQILIEEDDF